MAQNTVTFLSKFSQHELIRQPKLEAPTPTGLWVTAQQRVAYKFEPYRDPASGKLVGRVTVRPGQDKLDTDGNGWLAPGQDSGVMRDAVEALKAHREFGRDFWLEGHEPGTVYPRPQDFRRDIRVATATLNEEMLAMMIEQERSTHGRGDLVAEAEDALDIVRKTVVDQGEPKPAAKAKPKASA